MSPPAGLRCEAVPAPAHCDGPCWIWTGRLNRNGYGRMWCPVTKREPVAHRLIYELLVGPIPDGLVLDHLCRVRACINPDHMEPITQAENVRRGEAILFQRLAA